MKLFNALFHSSLGKIRHGDDGPRTVWLCHWPHVSNLQIFLGPDKINAYGAFLKSMPKLLWVARISLLACVFRTLLQPFLLSGTIVVLDLSPIRGRLVALPSPPER